MFVPLMYSSLATMLTNFIQNLSHICFNMLKSFVQHLSTPVMDSRGKGKGGNLRLKVCNAVPERNNDWPFQQ